MTDIKKQTSNLCAYCRQEFVNNHKIGITEVEVRDMRLFEKPTEYRYESFDIPEKVIKFYCSKNCAKERLVKSIDMFLFEIDPIPPSRSNGKVL